MAAVVGGICVFVFAIGVHLYRDARLQDRINRMKILLFALENFQDTSHRLPQDAAGLDNSWRFELLPYTIGIKSPQDFREPWYSEANAAYRDFVLPEFCGLTCQTRVVRTPWNEHTRICPKGAVDGSCEPSVQILLIDFSYDTEWHWMQQGDTPLEQLPDAIRRSDRIVCGFADGEVWALSPGCAPLVQDFAAANAFSSREREERLGPYRVRPW